MRVLTFLTCVCAACSTPTVRAGHWRAAAEHVPATARAALYFEPSTAEGHTSGVGAVAGVVGRLFDAGLLGDIGPQQALLIDSIRAVPVIAEFPHLLILHDVHLRSVGAHSTRLDRLAISLVVFDGGAHQAIEARIAALLKRHTTSATAQLTTVQDGVALQHTLTDSRLPEWAQIHWGSRGDTYHVGIGRAAQPPAIDVGRTRPNPVATDAFITEAQRLTAVEEARVVLFVDWAMLLRSVGPRAAERAQAILQAAGIAPHRTLWIGSRRGRGLCLDMVQQQAGRLEHTILTAPLDAAEEQRFVPAEATWYARLNATSADVIRRCAAVYVAAHRQATRAALAAGWSTLDEDEEDSLTDLLLRPLHGVCIVHNAPPHALLPALLVTVRMDIIGDSAGLQKAVDVVMTHFAAYLTRHSGWFRPQLHRSPEGWWYSQFGVYGPALAVTENTVVITHSLPALRRLVLAGQPARSD